MVRSSSHRVGVLPRQYISVPAVDSRQIPVTVSLKVIDRHNIVEHFFKTFIEEPLVRIRLDLDQIRKIQNFLDPGIRPACPVLTIIH